MSDEIPDPCHELAMAVLSTETQLIPLLELYEQQLQALYDCRQANPWPGDLIPPGPISTTVQTAESVRQMETRAHKFRESIRTFRGQR